MEQEKWGLVLAGGGGRGAYQIGVWRALREFGLDKRIAAVSGVSVGALNAVLFGLGNLEAAEDIWRNISPADFLKMESDTKERGDGVFTREGLLRLMNDRISFDAVSACEKPLYVAASYAQGGRMMAEYFTLNGKSKEEIQSILLASSAIPVVYDSVKIGDKIYRDGGVKDNLPIQPLYDAGFRKLIVIGLTPQTRANAFDYPGAEFLPILPSQDLGDVFTGILDFSRQGALTRLQLGYQDGKAVLDWYFSDQKKTWSEFQAGYRKDGKERYQKFRQEQQEQLQKRLETEITAEVEKLKELIRSYRSE